MAKIKTLPKSIDAILEGQKPGIIEGLRNIDLSRPGEFSFSIDIPKLPIHDGTTAIVSANYKAPIGTIGHIFYTTVENFPAEHSDPEIKKEPYAKIIFQGSENRKLRTLLEELDKSKEYEKLTLYLVRACCSGR